MKKRLYRSRDDKMVAGVCAGIAEYLDIDPVFVRLIWAALILFEGFGLLLYILFAIIVPKNPKDNNLPYN